MQKINLSKSEESTLNRVVPKAIIKKMENPTLLNMIEITKELERILPKKITDKLRKCELDGELIDLIQINEKVNGEYK
jgi:hypothetical protein